MPLVDGSGRALPPPPPAVPRESRPDGPRVSRRNGGRLPGWLGVGISVLVALQLVSIGLQITQLLVAARRETTPPPAPAVVAAPVVAPEPLTGLVLVAGGEAYLDQVGKRLPIGTVPVGRYTLFVLPAGATDFIDEGTVEVHADDHLVFHCTTEGCVKSG